MNRGIVLEIDLNKLRANLGYIKKKIGHRKIIAVVKADAYGHGAIEISRILEKEGISFFGVAYLSEAIELRESGITSPIVVFFDNDITDDIIKYSLIPVVNSIRTAKEISKLSRRFDKDIPVHINIDTGMGRMGIRHDTFNRDFEKIVNLPGIKITGIMSHFSDADLSDHSFAINQLEIFQKARSFLNSRGIMAMAHMANSAAVINLPETYLDAVRPGILFYGISPCHSDYENPIMEAKSSIIDIRRLKKGTPISYGRTYITQRNSLIGLIPGGYADGIMRAISNRGRVLVRGRPVQVVGRICMDLTMIDLTDVRDVRVGDEVVLMGTQGSSRITAEDLAKWAGTISYEILTTLGNSGRRIYRGLP